MSLRNSQSWRTLPSSPYSSFLQQLVLSAALQTPEDAAGTQ